MQKKKDSTKKTNFSDPVNSFVVLNSLAAQLLRAATAGKAPKAWALPGFFRL